MDSGAKKDFTFGKKNSKANSTDYLDKIKQRSSVRPTQNSQQVIDENVGDENETPTQEASIKHTLV